MKIFLFSMLGIFWHLNAKAQKPLDTDSLVKEICFTAEYSIQSTDSETVSNAFSSHLDFYKKRMTKETFLKLADLCYYRSQTICPAISNLLTRMQEENLAKLGWKTVDKEPESEISLMDCGLFFKKKKLWYLNGEKDTVYVSITDSSWTDHFSNGTWSRLSLKQYNPCEFVITFRESNNNVRSAMSKPGDQYRYAIIKKGTNYYELFTQRVGQPMMTVFRMYE